MTRDTELLSPAGGREEFYAAMNAGSDAVYTGLKLYSARKNAKNLTLDELKEITSYAHLTCKKVYIALNTLLFDDEIKKLISIMPKILKAAPDGIIIQDMGLFSVLKQFSKGVELHASTQMTADNFFAVATLSNFGFDRVVVAREMNISEIKDIKENLDVDIETFVHGALCVCYSGECYFSSALGERSANRGDCAQPCRKRYQLMVDGNLTGKNGFYLSMKDLNTSENIEEIANYSDSLKIEGRMKNKEYVKFVTEYYRKKLDGDFITKADDTNVVDIFSRGFTKGFVLDANKDMINPTSPKHMGSLIGKVEKSGDRFSEITLQNNLYKDDGITYELIDGNKSGTKVERNIKLGETLKIYKKLKLGTNVFRNYSAKLYEPNSSAYDIKKLPVAFFVKAQIDEKFAASALCGDRFVEVTTDTITQKAKSDVNFKDIATESFSRLGDTFFRLDYLNYEGNENAFVPKSVLNAVRRDLVKKLMTENSTSFEFKNGLVSSDKTKKTPKISLKVSNKLNSKNLKGICEIRIDYLDKNKIELMKYYRVLGFEPVIIMPAIMNKDDVINAKAFIEEYSVTRIVANNFGILNADCEIIIGDSFNVANRFAIEFYKNHGIHEFLPSREMTYSQILDTFTDVTLRLPYYTKTVSMVAKTIAEDVGLALEKSDNVAIVDLKNEVFKVEKKNNLYYIYNSKPLFMAKRIDKVNCDILEISYDENFDSIIEFLYNGGEIGFSYTTGHYNKGVAR
ncbi:MAG: U32 family peptidase [Ezakiella sp.]|nr:U32 family peptidase [Ezakiella sp.]MDD7471578.1 U32 family peptidase [Bacillota bacterium]MDY3922814.1 U32 family peptidase [Ezakiella sp.]